ncbi:LOW QUALITY PROTEIN: general transcription factor II-I repeat domain-containing protein 1 [Trematomus bernacchii]|uniref:LOW QUALITY PROTEIN: general transcription factor II-I repeat domain-containing protein 1 n=1 Tax=Trematomus bernacchii TaxID=40690 RepID=UPI001469CF06|nr:LOW QUALITY PROTEIN: general transcription factor II-I repeat domain-containing protein 1 [Trematomus bernacchii]
MQTKGMAQMRKLACDGIRTNSRGGDSTAPLVSARQEILTSLVSALDSVCMAMSKLNAEVACVTVHEDSVIAVGTEKGRVFLNSRREIQTDFYKFCRGPCLQNVPSANAHTKEQEVDLSKLSKDGDHGKPRAPSEAQSNIFVLRKMVEEVFTVLYSEAVGKSSLVPVPYERILKDPGCVVAHGLPEGASLKKPSEYDTKTLMKILEQSHRIQFTVKKPAEDLSREAKSSTDVNHNCTAPLTPGSHGSGKTSSSQGVSSPSPASSSNSVLSNFLYGMPMSSKPHPDGKLDFKPMSLLNLGTDRLNNWTAGTDKMASVKDCPNNDETTRLPGEQGQSPPGVHISKRLLFSIVHEKSEKWDSFIRETEDINTLRECVQILFNSRYAEALGLDHMVPVPYRKIACDPGAVEIIGIPDQIPFKRPCTYGVPKLKRILDERHGIRFIVKRMFDERIFTAAGKIAREEGKLDPGSLPEDGFLDNTEGGGRDPHCSRSASACVSPLADCEAGPSADCIPLKRIKTEPPDGDIIQVTVPDAVPGVEEAADSVSEPVAAAAACPPPSPPQPPPSAPSAPPTPSAPREQMENHAAEALSPSATSQSIPRSSEAGSLVEDIGEMILQLRRQVESLFSVKYADALGLPEPAKVPYSKFQMYPEDLYVTGMPEGIALRRPNCFGANKLRKILAVGSQIQFVINRPELLTEQVKQEMPSMPICDPELDAKDDSPEDAAALRPGFPECLESKLSRIDLANTLREQVQDMFNRKYGEALGIKYPVQVPYKRIKNNPDSVIIEGLPPGIPFRKPCTFGSQNLERILAVADKINFTITRPFQGLIPKPAPRRVTLLKKAYASISDDDDINRMGEKVVLREQVKELFNKKYGEALGLDRSVVVPYKLIRGSPESVEISGLPDDIPFRNPNTYDIVCLEKVLQAADQITFNIVSQLQPFAEICSQPCNTAGTEASTNRRKRKRVQESSRGPASSEHGISTNQIPVMQWPMYMVDYSGVNVQVPGKVNY